MRSTQAAAILRVLTLTAEAQQKPLVIEHGIYNVHLIQHTIGAEEYTITNFGSHRELTISTTTNDRGMKRTTSTTLDFTPDYSPSHLEQHSVSTTPTLDTGSLIEVHGPNATVRELSTTRTFAKPTIAFPGLTAMPASLQMMMMRYWLTHHRPEQLPLLRASPQAPPIHIEAVGHEAFELSGRTVRLTRYTIDNLIFGREILWLNESNRVAAIMTFASGLPQEYILDQYESAFDAIFRSGVRQQMLGCVDVHLVRMTVAAR